MSNSALIIGIDEVGRGAWAGPLLVVAARLFGAVPRGLKDSKLLTKKQREKLFFDILLAYDIGEGWVLASEIDHIGLAGAMRLAVRRALESIQVKETDVIIIDGNTNYCPSRFINSSCQIKADQTVSTVSAASILAKVLRDRFMTEQATLYNEFSFQKHVGYGTAQHLQEIKEFGISELHRVSFQPIKKLLAENEIPYPSRT